jgi:hypothetical protein
MRITTRISVAVGLGVAALAVATPAFAANDDPWAPVPAVRQQICADPDMHGYLNKFITGKANNGTTLDFYVGDTPSTYNPANVHLMATNGEYPWHLSTINCLAG